MSAQAAVRDRESLKEDIHRLARENAELRQEMHDIKERLDAIEAVVDTDPTHMDYEAMDRHDKAVSVRAALAEDARDRDGKAAMNYREVRKWFDDKPSPGHAYDIMELAAEADGYDYDTPKNGQKRVTVDLGRVNDPPPLSRRE